MKLPGLILFMLLSVQLYAQHVNGLVLDKGDGLPIPGAVVKNGNSIQLTSSNGSFTLTNAHPGDSVRITFIGYNPYYLALGASGTDTIRVYLIPGTILLNNVNIRARYDRKIDSLQNRHEFARVFDYKAPTFIDIFDTVDRFAYTPNNYITSGNNTTQLVNVNVLSLISLFGKNKTPASRLHDLAIKQEKLDYIDERFSREKIVTLTKLKGDSLNNFIYLYRPAIDYLKTMKEYDLEIYIKKSYEEYKSGKNPDKVPVLK